jgi:hypothetical protein
MSTSAAPNIGTLVLCFEAIFEDRLVPSRGGSWSFARCFLGASRFRVRHFILRFALRCVMFGAFWHQHKASLGIMLVDFEDNRVLFEIAPRLHLVIGDTQCAILLCQCNNLVFTCRRRWSRPWPANIEGQRWCAVVGG